MDNKKLKGGFTIIELLFSLTLNLLLLCLAIPALGNIVEKRKLEAYALEWRSQLQYAKSLALVLHQNVWIYPQKVSNDGKNLWQAGAKIMLNNEVVGFISELTDEQKRIKVLASRSEMPIQFQPGGVLMGMNRTLSFYLDAPASMQIQIILSSTGRIRWEKG